MQDIMEAALKAKERTEAQLAITNEDKVHLDVWPNESPAGKLWLVFVFCLIYDND